MPRNYYDVEYDSGPGFGELFGQGLSQGLEELVTHKLGQIKDRHQQKITERSYEGFGAPKSIARALATATPEIQKQYLESGAAASWPQLKQQELQQLQGPRRNQQVQQQQQPQQVPIESQKIKQQLGNALNPTGDQRQEELLSKIRNPKQQEQDLTKQGLPVPAQQQQAQQPYPTGYQTPIENAPGEQRTKPAEKPRPPSINEAIESRIASATEGKEGPVPFAKPGMTAVQHKQNLAEQKLINQETEPVAKKINDDYQFAKFAEPRINKMEKLIDQGGLPISALYKLFKGLEEHPEKGAALGSAVGGAAALATGAGLVAVPGAAAVGGAVGGGLSALMGPILQQIQRTTSPNTESYEKLSAEFLKGAKSVFGGQFTNAEMDAYLAMIPTLMNTDAGKRAIIENMRTFNKAAKINYRAYRQILQENGGKRPYDLEEQIEARTQPQLEKLSDIFREDFAAALA